MGMAEHLVAPMVIDISAADKTLAVEELVKVACKALGMRRQKAIVDEVLKREETSSTYIGQQVALPHARVPLENEFAIVVGRSAPGIPFDAARGGQAHIVVLLLIDEKIEHQKHLQLLADIAAVFKTASVRDAIMKVDGPVNLSDILSAPARSKAPAAARATRRPQDPLATAAIKLAGEIKATIGQRYALEDIAQAHRDLEARKTTGSTIITL